MRTEVLEYNCIRLEDKIELRLEHWGVARYPMTFTPRECLEEFCHTLGWEFVKCGGDNHVGPFYTFHCKVHPKRLVMDIIYDWHKYYRGRVEAGTL